MSTCGPGSAASSPSSRDPPDNRFSKSSFPFAWTKPNLSSSVSFWSRTSHKRQPSFTSGCTGGLSCGSGCSHELEAPEGTSTSPHLELLRPRSLARPSHKASASTPASSALPRATAKASGSSSLAARSSALLSSSLRWAASISCLLRASCSSCQRCLSSKDSSAWPSAWPSASSSSSSSSAEMLELASLGSRMARCSSESSQE
mmetsp:Transcript_11822/g.33405  ORF Transcript_11822/g.33405 Transcript_11822/m.33405 type:complete len:203 (-) Transcript_11822:1164-1772(-)